jgi:hypothetical protein
MRLTQTPETGSAGNIWYDPIDNVIKYSYDGFVEGSGTWSTGGNMITARGRLAGAGTQNEGLAFGGYVFGFSNATEEYNGTSWSTGGNLSAAKRYLGGAGSQGAGLAFGGGTPTIQNATEEYNQTAAILSSYI